MTTPSGEFGIYKTILIPVENSAADDTILRHIRPLAKLTSARLLLIHVADGFAARYQNQLNLEDSEEIRLDREYLERRRAEFQSDGFAVEVLLARGEPAQEILAAAQREGCDLIAMATHGHRFIKDVLLGSVAENVRHRTSIPVLLVRVMQD
ncbi:MAG: universal stress protein [Phycisphaerales bacterium]|nr:universal stress protein [Phycisphaerales bacterium]